MDVREDAIGVWPNVALVPGTHTHAATGEHVEQPEWTRMRPSLAKLMADLAATRHAALGLWRRADALRMAGRAPSQGDLDEMAALLAGVGIEAS